MREATVLAACRYSTLEELRAHSLVDESKDSRSYTLAFLDIGDNKSPPSEALRVP